MATALVATFTVDVKYAVDDEGRVVATVLIGDGRSQTLVIVTDSGARCDDSRASLSDMG